MNEALNADPRKELISFLKKDSEKSGDKMSVFYR